MSSSGPIGSGSGGATGSSPYTLKGSGTTSGSTTSPMGGSEMTPPIPVGSGTTGTTLPLKKMKARYEFIVLFIWKEPRPSDKFISKEETGTTTTTPAPLAPPRPMGNK